ncbi:MAG: hypothetical protein HYW26_01685 [Candidatus Aenigmarchaeota archaeon]|nr:hypothetical protein [Candidatus Aenigmarchaeota archaeon]
MNILSRLRSKGRLIHVIAYAALGFVILTPFLLSALQLFSFYQDGRFPPAEWFIHLIPGLITGISLFLLAAAKGKLVPDEHLVAGVAFAGLGSLFIGESVLSVFSIFRLSFEMDYTFLLMLLVELIAGLSFLALAVINLFEKKGK